MGDFGAARNALSYATALLDRKTRTLKDEFALDVAIRIAQVERSEKDALVAIRLALSIGSPYRESTARLVAGMIGLACDAPSAREHFERVLAFEDSTSWLYRAESWLALGCLALTQDHIANAYRYLIASQYVYTILGLQPMPHPDLPVPAATRTDLLPIDLLRDPRFAALSEDECTELRERAIIESRLRTHIFFDLAGWSGKRPRGACDPTAV